MAKFKKLAVLSSALLATAAFATLGACENVCTFESAWTKDDTHHWHVCSDEACTEVSDKAEHVNDDGLVAADGTVTYKCIVCDADAHEHEWSTTKTTGETTTWYDCTDENCFAKFGEEAIPAAPHVCDFGTEYESDENGHWLACDCGETVAAGDHVGESWTYGEETVAPQVGVAGEWTYTCEVCGYQETEEIPALEASPYIVAEGTVTASNYTWYDLTLNMEEAGEYVVITDNEAIGFEQFTVTEAGENTVSLSIFDFTVEIGSDLTFNYVVKRVPTISPTEFYGDVEIVTFAYVKVSFNMPAGRYSITANNAMFSRYIGDTAEETYAFNVAEDDDLVEFYAIANSSEEDTVLVSYTLTEIYPEYIADGNNTLTLLSSMPTEVCFTTQVVGKYKIETYDSYSAFWKDGDYGKILDTLNGITYFEVTEADFNNDWERYEKTFYVTGNSATSFKVSSLTDAEIAAAGISWTFEEDATVATTEATLGNGTYTATLMDFGLYQISWNDGSVTLVINDGQDDYYANTQSVIVALSPFSMMTLSFVNYNYGETSDTFTLTMIDGTNNAINATTEIFVPSGMATPSMELPAQLAAGDYEMSIDSENVEVIYGFADNGDGTFAGTTLSSTAETVTATGEIELVYVAGSLEATFVTLTITAADEGGEGGDVTGTGVFGDPYIIPAAGYAFSDLAIPTNPMTGMAMNILFEYTAEEDGVMTISGVNNLGYIQDADSNFVELIEGTLSFNVVAGTTYSIKIGAQDMANSPISPVFTFGTEGGEGGDEGGVTGTGVFGDPYIIPAAGYAFSDLAIPTNPMTGMAMNILFEYTAEEDGIMMISGVNNLSYIQDADSNFVELIEGTNNFNVVAGTTYTIEIGAQDMANSPISPVFTFAA